MKKIHQRDTTIYTVRILLAHLGVRIPGIELLPQFPQLILR